MQNGREAGGMARYRARMAPRWKPTLPDVYERLRGRFGPAGWWPAETPFEVALGAILVQNTSWTNVERVLAGLRGRGLLSHRALFPLARAGAGGALPRVRHLQREGAPGPRVPRLPGGRVRRRDRADGSCGSLRPARGAPGGAGHRPRDRGLHRALRRGASVLRRRRLHPPRVRTAGAPARRRDLPRRAGLLPRPPARGSRPLQRLPRADRPRGEGLLPARGRCARRARWTGRARGSGVARG